ncbi:D-2-hydroxyacid dehydrogenase [Halolamina sp. C58]|uniref:D-2-hydroxyacid dehydrogenase n=1 Tax=Halolamina sp. C58 TaxID=3421640 RepID=UPI003EB9811A
MVTRIGIHTSIEALFPPAVLRDRLDDLDPEAVVVDTDELDGVDGLVTFAYDDAFLDAGLDWIHSVQSGVDRFPFDALEAAGTSLTNSTGVHGDSVGETVAGYMLSFARRLHEFRSKQEREQWAWADWDAPFTLADSAVCVVGLGTLGRGIAARADALGMDVTGVKRTPTPVDHVDTVHPSSELRTAIDGPKFVALAVPLTEETEGLIGADELAAMRDDAVLVNVARGAVVEQSALIDALRADELAGAALDVFETEPLPEGSPLWGMDDVIVTPHSAAAHREYPDRMAALIRENVRRIDRGERLANQVV